MTVMARIRKEYGEPFKDVVIGYAEMGYSKRATAKNLQISSLTLYKYLDRFNLHGHFKPQDQQRQECRRGNRGKNAGALRLDLRRPIEHTDGLTYYPGEPTHHYLFVKKS
jgi:hypothetical protein